MATVLATDPSPVRFPLFGALFRFPWLRMGLTDFRVTPGRRE